MEKKRLLFVTQEMEPYTEGNFISYLVARLPKLLHDNGFELRILMPRYGIVNERRHRLHEVVRLSGMNIIVDDDDYPLIIKVASLPNSRLQVYFLDNEDFFRRRFLFEDEKGMPFEDNPDRAAFFCKGALETVKKFGWPPDIILCHGWLSGLIPLYVRKAYQMEPLFMHSTVVFCAYDTPHERLNAEHFLKKAAINNIQRADLEPYLSEEGAVSMHKGAFYYADAVVLAEAGVQAEAERTELIARKPVLTWRSEENGNMFEGLLNFLRQLTTVEEVS
ncbi:MAG: glycogen/starch synthase [Saprospiraceae bacterium]|nr:glycogen/starch synthase [Saprospiraceae bacterium]MDW8483433.1 glycogen/starch synthase [Saprospiraceae bacterium]